MQRHELRRFGLTAALATTSIAGIAIAVSLAVRHAGVEPNAAAAFGTAAPRWLLCGLSVIGTVANLFIPSPVAGVYAAAFASLARAYCT